MFAASAFQIFSVLLGGGVVFEQNLFVTSQRSPLSVFKWHYIVNDRCH
jgi:hypothetical protein